MMTQTEFIDARVRYRQVKEQDRIATDDDYDRSLGMLRPSSGTAYVAEQGESDSAEMYWRSLADEYANLVSDNMFFGSLAGEPANNVTVSTTFKIVHGGSISGEASNTSIVIDFIDSSAKDATPDGELGETKELTGALRSVVDHARSQGLLEIADRLILLSQQPLDEDEVLLQAASAMCFVEYCLARQKQIRPLMTVTPAGELDATWKGPDKQSLVMRFFPNGSVWVAYKLLRGRGSFEAAAADLLAPDFDYKIPDWA